MRIAKLAPTTIERLAPRDTAAPPLESRLAVEGHWRLDLSTGFLAIRVTTDARFFSFFFFSVLLLPIFEFLP